LEWVRSNRNCRKRRRRFGLARCCWVDEGSLLAMIEMERARCGQQMTGISRKRLSEQRLFGGGLLHSMSILTEKFQALMAGKP
jgi:hypothetical protein